MAEPNGLYYMRARYYDPSIGRFISEDPIGLGGVNFYAYVLGNPISYIDPNGLDTYYVSKELFGSNPTEDNPFSHSFIAITDRNSKGKEVVTQTFSWTDKNHGSWEDPLNVKNRIVAQTAIDNSIGIRKVGNEVLDSAVVGAFKHHQNEQGGYNINGNNCKDQATRLIDQAYSENSARPSGVK